MGTIILVRHGENDWTKKHKLAGWLASVHLNESGHRQAAAVAQRLAALPIKAVYSSPLTRCVETAAYIADTHRLAVQHLEEVGEVHYGKWEGKKIKKLAGKPLWRAVQFFPSRARFPEGESLYEVQFRAVQALEETAARHEKEMIVVVSHADVIRLLLAHYLGVHIDLFQRLIIAPASVSILNLSPDGLVRVLRLNDDGPLRAPDAAEAKTGKHPRREKSPRRAASQPPAQSNGRPTTTAAIIAGDGREPPAAKALDEEE